MATTSKKRAPYAKSAERKLEVATAALALVDEIGHAKVTTAAVAERAGIPERTVLYHFPTRADLLLAAVQLNEQLREAATIAAHKAEDPDPAEHIRFVIETGLQYPNRLRLVVALLGEASDPDHPAHDHMREYRRASITGVSEMLQRGKDHGFVHPDVDPDVLGLPVVAAWSGLEAQWLLDPSFDLPGTVAKVVRRLTRQEALKTRQEFEKLIERI